MLTVGVMTLKLNGNLKHRLLIHPDIISLQRSQVSPAYWVDLNFSLLEVFVAPGCETSLVTCCGFCVFLPLAAQGCLQAVQVLCEHKSPINLKDLVSTRRPLEVEMDPGFQSTMGSFWSIWQKSAAF